MYRHIKSIIVVSLAVTTLGFIALDQTHLTYDDTPATQNFPSGQTVPDTTFPLLDGGTISLHSMSGHVVWLHFWASWCVPCRAEFSDLLKRIEKGDGNTVLLAVSGDANAADARKFLAPFIKEYKPLFDSKKVIVAHDPEHKLIEGVFETFKYPETIIINPDLTMKQKIIGAYKEP